MSTQPEIALVALEFRSHELSNSGYKVTNYSDQDEAIRSLKIRRNHKLPLPDLILSRGYYTEDDSYARLLGYLQGFAKHLPLIVLDLHQSAYRREEVKDLGAVDYLPMRIPLTNLQYQIERVLKVSEHVANHISGSGPRTGFTKRLFDIVIASFLLLLLSPLFLFVILAIRLESRGPVFYHQLRVGRGYHIFKFFKFRSMRLGADQLMEQMDQQNSYERSQQTKALDDPTDPVLVSDDQMLHEGQYLIDKKMEEAATFKKFKNDPRITRVGQFIRKTSIDELPQLVNVLIGDMSLVGNRPLPLYEAEKLTVDDWSARFSGPAGITGLWQVTERGKSNVSADSRKALDIEYAQRHSFWLDMKILIKTPLAALQQENV